MSQEIKGRFVINAKCRNDQYLDRPLVGQAGKEVDRVLSTTGFSRGDCSFTTAILCRPPNDELKLVQAKTRKENKKRKKAGKSLILQPEFACRTRLIRELYEYPNLLILGKIAWESIYKEKSGDAKFAKNRGFPDKIELPPLPGYESKIVNVLTTYDPGYIIKARRWTIPFENDVQKAGRMVQQKLVYHEPDMLFFPTPTQLANFLAVNKEHLAYDWETNGVESLTAIPWCVGIGNDKHVTCVPFDSVERPKKRYYTKPQRNKVERIFKDFYDDESGFIYSHNGKYDQQIWESNFPWFQMRRKQFDTIIAHHNLYSEWSHDLGFLSSQFSDASAHKDVKHDHWDDDYTLHKYCMYDVAQTSLAAQKMVVNPTLYEMRNAFNMDMFLSEFCRQMHKIGVEIDIEERDRHFKKLNDKMAEEKSKIQYIAYKVSMDYRSKGSIELAKNLNPGSTQQVSNFLFDVCGIPLVPAEFGGLTDAGEPSIGKDQLFYLIDQGLAPNIEEFIFALIAYKEAQTLRGFCKQEPGFDGRVHANWNPHVVVSGRLSCSQPNLMNLRKWLRSMYRAAKGHTFVTCDKSQLEARVMAILTDDKVRIDAFLNGADIHKVNALGVLGKKSVDDVTPEERQFTKTFVYAVQYLAGKKTAHRMIKNFVDQKTNERPYRALPYNKVADSCDLFWEDRHMCKTWHEDNRAHQQQIGYLEDALHGRRRYFLDGGGDDQKEELANFIIQSTAAADVNNATKRLSERFPWGFDGPYTGIVHQCHDSLTLEVKEEHALEYGREMQKIMYSEFRGMPLPVDLAIGKDLYNLEEID
jgi:DNA polymerase I-like protein with 3'-5' exonuclease and polymerase domains/uracil-DNA glycosylase